MEGQGWAFCRNKGGRYTIAFFFLQFCSKAPVWSGPWAKTRESLHYSVVLSPADVKSSSSRMGSLTKGSLWKLTKLHVLELPIPAFFVFLAFFVLRFSLLFRAFLLSFPRISRVLQRGESLFFLPKKSKDWRVRVDYGRKVRICAEGLGKLCGNLAKSSDKFLQTTPSRPPD